jgi:cytochrome c heme-lyase
MYNVYSQPIDESNQMPTSIANQLPAPNQKLPLSTERVSSTIPKGNASEDTETWTYPSPQMFYNALVRKGKLGTDDDPTLESDMESVVALHNYMNEHSWNQIVAWEALVGETKPKLLKFMGRPTDLSPKARIKHWFFQHPLPFDRHDWTVQRSDGTTVRYVLDYYHDDAVASEEPGSGLPSLPNIKNTTTTTMTTKNTVKSLIVDVRPALDSPHQFYHRMIVMPWARWNIGKESNHSTIFPSLEIVPLRPSESLRGSLQESKQIWDTIQQHRQPQQPVSSNQVDSAVSISQDEATALASTMQQAVMKCRKAQDALTLNCHEDGDEDNPTTSSSSSSVACQRASLDLTMCLGTLWCPLQHEALVKALTTTDDTNSNDTIDVALERLSICVGSAHARVKDARMAYPSIFETKK